MAYRWLIYRTGATFNNTIVRESLVSGTTEPAEKELYSDFFIHDDQPLYLWRVNNGETAVEQNTQANIYAWINQVTPPPAAYDLVLYHQITGFTSGGTSTASGERITKLIDQPGHGFLVGDVLGWSGGTYNKPVADGLYNGEVLGIVSKCYNTSCFDLTQAGYVTGLTGLVINSTYFLSPTTPGLLTDIEPSGNTQISKAVLIATASDTAWVLPYPGYVISTGSTSGIVFACNGLTSNGTTVCLGGDLTGNTTIDVKCHTFTIVGAPSAPFIAINDIVQAASTISIGSKGCTSICGCGTAGVEVVAGGLVSLNSSASGAYINIDGLNGAVGIYTTTVCDTISLITNGGSYISLDGSGTQCVFIGDGVGTLISVGSNAIELNAATLCIVQIPADGTCSDSILVWNSGTKAINKVPYVSGATVNVPVSGATNGLCVCGGNATLGGILTGSTCVGTGIYTLVQGVCGGVCDSVLHVEPLIAKLCNCKSGIGNAQVYSCIDAGNFSAAGLGVLNDSGGFANIRACAFGAGCNPIVLCSSDGSYTTDLGLASTGITVNTTYLSFAGIQYALDYCPYFTNRSLVDKSYVDAQIGLSGVTASNGLTKYSGNIIGLGGLLTGNTTIDVNGFTLCICGAPAQPFISIDDTVTTCNILCLTSNGCTELSSTGGYGVCVSALYGPIGIGAGTNFTLGFNGTGIITDSTPTPLGLQYALNTYRNSFTECSLVDKGYVDAQIGLSGITASNGLTKYSGNIIGLGGVLTGATTICTTGNDFKIINNPGGNCCGLQMVGTIYGDCLMLGSTDKTSEYIRVFSGITLCSFGFGGNMNLHGDNICICSDTNTTICANYLQATGIGTVCISGASGLNLGGTVNLTSTPADGTCTDSVLVWNSSTCGINKVPYVSGGTGGGGGSGIGWSNLTNGSTVAGCGSLPTGCTATTCCNTLFGVNAGPSISTGWGHTGIGFGALNGETTGLFNVAVGHQSMFAGNNNSANVAVGYQSLYNASNSGNNIAIGSQALYTTTISNDNIAIGAYVLSATTTGCDNIGIGSMALWYNTTGRLNTGIGSGSLRNNTIGEENIGVGYYTLVSNTTGWYNVAIGTNALAYNSTGSKNIAIGNAAMWNYYIGSGNTVIGDYAGASGDGNYNVMIGRCAGNWETGTVSNKLHIANNANSTLICGDFAAKTVCIDGKLSLSVVSGGTCTDSILVLSSAFASPNQIRKVPYFSGKTLSRFTISGDSATTGFTVNHAMGQQFVMVEIVQAASPYATIYTSTRRPNANCVCVTFDTAPANGCNYCVLITG